MCLYAFVLLCLFCHCVVFVVTDHAAGLLLYPLKTPGFLMFSRGIEVDQWQMR